MINFSSDNISNQELYEMCAAGDESAWEYVYNYVLSVARWPRWGPRESPEDLAQAIVLHLLEKGMRQVRQPAAFRGYIRRVAVNKILDSFKKRIPDGPRLDAPQGEDDDSPVLELASPNPDPEAQVMDRDLLAKVGAALLSLPDYCRRVLPQYFRLRLGIIASYQELSKILGSPVGTISAQVRRCLDYVLRQPGLAEGLREA
ncbi:MAG: RNA polymerase sigma factor [Thermodesulfobacteriota bacterium]